jgi:hypothetical protein
MAGVMHLLQRKRARPSPDAARPRKRSPVQGIALGLLLALPLWIALIYGLHLLLNRL